MRRITLTHKQPHLMFLQFSMAIVFFWFGLLKLVGASPVGDIVANAFPLIGPGSALFELLAIVEVLIGAGFLIPRFTRWAAWIAVFHLLLATFGVLISPQAFVSGFPYLSITGEFVVKNFVLIAAALLVAAPDVPEKEKIKV